MVAVAERSSNQGKRTVLGFDDTALDEAQLFVRSVARLDSPEVVMLGRMREVIEEASHDPVSRQSGNRDDDPVRRALNEIETEASPFVVANVKACGLARSIDLATGGQRIQGLSETAVRFLDYLDTRDLPALGR